MREISEELLCTVQVDNLVCTSQQHYSFGTVELSTFVCHLVEGDPHLTEHQDAKWLTPNALTTLDWAPADREAMEILSHLSFSARSATQQ